MSELFFSVKTKDKKSVEAVLAKQSSVEFDGLNVLSDSLKIGQLFFIVFGGDKPAWETGLVGLGLLSKLPYDFEGKNFKIQIDIKILFTKPIKREDLVLFPDTYNILGIGPITKWEPNQALTQVPEDKAYALLNAILLIDAKKRTEFEMLLSPEQYCKVNGRFRHYKEIDPNSITTDDIESIFFDFLRLNMEDGTIKKYLRSIHNYSEKLDINIFTITDVLTLEQEREKIQKSEFYKEEKARNPNSYSLYIDTALNHYSDFLESEFFKKHFSKKISQDINLNVARKFIPSEAFSSPFSRRYIISLLAKPFVILTGNSGTGKTRIAKQFAQYLEKSSGDIKNWLLVPVGSDWTDNTKILGYYNPLANNGTGKYEKTEILKLMEAAVQNPAIPFFLILDEMNLSHVERYFSDFLSHMETPDVPFKIDHYDELKFPSNLFITGTVNIDETTYMFSPKVLDRANVIEFKPEKDDVMNLLTDANESSDIQKGDDGMAEGFMELANKIRDKNYKIDLSTIKLDDAKSILETIYSVLEPAGFEFAFRTVKEIRQYIIATYELDSSTFDLNKVLDEQIVQKILPKIHGNKKQLGTLLKDLAELCLEDKYPLSAKKISQMQKKLENQQYASFI